MQRKRKHFQRAYLGCEAQTGQSVKCVVLHPRKHLIVAMIPLDIELKVLYESDKA